MTFIHLLGEKGLTGVTMQEIGKNTGGPIASVYQYFPDKSSILKTALEPLFLQARETASGIARGMRTQQDALLAVGRYSEEFALFVINQRSQAALFAAKRAEKRVALVDMSAKMENADILLSAASRYIPRGHALEYRRLVLQLLDFHDDWITVALKADAPAADLLMEDFKRFADSSFQAFRS